MTLLGGPVLIGAFFWNVDASFRTWLGTCREWQAAGPGGVCSDPTLDADPPGSAVATATCPSMTEAKAIKAAIAAVVERARAEQAEIDHGSCPTAGRQPGRPCLGFLPYGSVDAFEAANPDCCTMPEKLPGEEPPEMRALFQGLRQPKLFLVEMRYKVRFAGKDGKEETGMTNTSERVTCSGYVLPGTSFTLDR